MVAGLLGAHQPQSQSFLLCTSLVWPMEKWPLAITWHTPSFLLKKTAPRVLWALNYYSLSPVHRVEPTLVPWSPLIDQGLSPKPELPWGRSRICARLWSNSVPQSVPDGIVTNWLSQIFFLRKKESLECAGMLSISQSWRSALSNHMVKCVKLRVTTEPRRRRSPWGWHVPTSQPRSRK